MHRFKQLFVKPVMPLGRWQIVDSKRTTMRAHRANEDHCGTCGWTQLTTLSKNKRNEQRCNNGAGSKKE